MRIIINFFAVFFMLLGMFSSITIAEELAPLVREPKKIAEKIDNEIFFDGMGIIDFYGDSLITISGKEFVINSSFSVQFFGGDKKRPGTLQIGQNVAYTLCKGDNKVCGIWVIKPEDKSMVQELMKSNQAIQ